jgi:hypothetical protein
MTLTGKRMISDLTRVAVSRMNGWNSTYASIKNLSEKADNAVINPGDNILTVFCVSDVIRCFFELVFYAETQAVKMTRFQIQFACDNFDGHIIIPCHSEGVIVTRNALLGLPKNYRDRVIVAAFAPGAYIDDHLAASVIHYRSTRDFVPYLDFFGKIRCQHSTVVLKPHSDAPLFDHPFDSPTYSDAKQNHLNRFMHQFGGC